MTIVVKRPNTSDATSSSYYAKRTDATQAGSMKRIANGHAGAVFPAARAVGGMRSSIITRRLRNP